MYSVNTWKNVSQTTLVLFCRWMTQEEKVGEYYYKAPTTKKKAHNRLHRLSWNGEILEKRRKCRRIRQMQKVCEFCLSPFFNFVIGCSWYWEWLDKLISFRSSLMKLKIARLLYEQMYSSKMEELQIRSSVWKGSKECIILQWFSERLSS